MKHARSLVAVALLSGFAATACSLLTSYDGLEGNTAPVEAGATDAADADADAAPPVKVCELARPPGPPLDGGSPADLGPLIAAAAAMSLTEAALDGGAFGADLDNLCTCPERAACIAPIKDPQCDIGEGGIDNAAVGVLAQLISFGVKVDDSNLNEGLKAGLYGLVFRLSGYSGAPDDGDVKLELLNAIGVNVAADAGPRFDGDDVWRIDDADVAGSDLSISVFSSVKGHVTNGVLVAEMFRAVPKLRVPRANGVLLVDIEMRNVIVTAKVSAAADGKVTLSEGRVLGRVLPATLLKQLQRAGACIGSVAFDTLKPLICNARDLPLDPGKDGRDVDCETLSMAVGFEATPARLDTIVGPANDTSTCPLNETAACN